MVEEQETRKATDILQEVETDIKEILAYVRNLDLKYNILLDKVNKLSAPQTINLNSSNNSNFNNTSVTSNAEFPEYKPQIIQQPKVEQSRIEQLKVELPQGKKSPFEQPSDLKSKIQLAMKNAKLANQTQPVEPIKKQVEPIIISTLQSEQKSSEKDHTRQIPTYQRIVYNDNKPVYMANVEIFEDSNLIKSMKTDQVGKWKTTLIAGEYQVKIKKAKNSLRPEVDLDYKIIVSSDKNISDLGTKTLE
jgi:hypothetical protein